jgi:hypothetical protein
MDSGNEAVLQKLQQLCVRISSLEDQYDESLDSAYSELLEFLLHESSHQPVLESQLVGFVRQFRHARELGGAPLSIDALAYVMHTLRWSAVLRAAEIEVEEYFAPRRDAALFRLTDAFNDGWGEADNYERYRKAP